MRDNKCGYSSVLASAPSEQHSAFSLIYTQYFTALQPAASVFKVLIKISIDFGGLILAPRAARHQDTDVWAEIILS